jgi:hypothetical protein
MKIVLAAVVALCLVGCEAGTAVREATISSQEETIALLEETIELQKESIGSLESIISSHEATISLQDLTAATREQIISTQDGIVAKQAEIIEIKGHTVDACMEFMSRPAVYEPPEWVTETNAWKMRGEYDEHGHWAGEDDWGPIVTITEHMESN